MISFQKIKYLIAKKLFKDVLHKERREGFRENPDAQRYNNFLKSPTNGINFLYSIEKRHMTDPLEDMLESGITNPNQLFSPLFNNAGNLLQNQYTSLNLDLANTFYEMVRDHENATGSIIDKSNLYFYMAMLYIANVSTINASIYWELTLQETARVSGIPATSNSIFNKMSTHFTSFLRPISLSHDNASLINTCLLNYPNVIENYETTLSNLQGYSILSYVACGARNVQVSHIFGSYFNSSELIKMYGQELISLLCTLNESLFKLHPGIVASGLQPHEKMIGRMIGTIPSFNTAVGSIIGIPGPPRSKSGYYVDPAFALGNEADFNKNLPTIVQSIFSLTLSEDELKARIIYCLHHIRNFANHDINSSLDYFNDEILFGNIISLLFMAVPVIQKL